MSKAIALALALSLAPMMTGCLTDVGASPKVMSFRKASQPLPRSVDKALVQKEAPSCPDVSAETVAELAKPTALPKEGALTADDAKKWIGDLEGQVADLKVHLAEAVDTARCLRQTTPAAAKGPAPQGAAAAGAAAALPKPSP